MSVGDNGLSERKGTTPFEKRQGPPRKEIVGGSCTADEKLEILGALEQEGFSTASEGVREVMLAFARDIEVRSVVRLKLEERQAA